MVAHNRRPFQQAQWANGIGDMRKSLPVVHQQIVDRPAVTVIGAGADQAVHIVQGNDGHEYGQQGNEIGNMFIYKSIHIIRRGGLFAVVVQSIVNILIKIEKLIATVRNKFTKAKK